MAINIRGIHACAANESWDLLSLLFYRDEKYAEDFMNANPEYCGMTAFRGGEKIRVPELNVTPVNGETVLANTIAPWR